MFVSFEEVIGMLGGVLGMGVRIIGEFLFFMYKGGDVYVKSCY